MPALAAPARPPSPHRFSSGRIRRPRAAWSPTAAPAVSFLRHVALPSARLQACRWARYRRCCSPTSGSAKCVAIPSRMVPAAGTSRWSRAAPGGTAAAKRDRRNAIRRKPARQLWSRAGAASMHRPYRGRRPGCFLSRQRSRRFRRRRFSCASRSTSSACRPPTTAARHGRRQAIHRPELFAEIRMHCERGWQGTGNRRCNSTPKCPEVITEGNDHVASVGLLRHAA